MQKLSAKLENVPVDIPHVCCSTSSSLNKEETLSVGNRLKNTRLTDNNLDAALTSVKRGKASKVFVINQTGRPIMPTTPRKARKLLESSRATVKNLTPFTIQLTYRTEGATQPITLGEDSGYNHIGLSAVSEKEELYSIDVNLRTDMVKLNSERKMYRRTRRNRLWYRKPRFNNRVKPIGWLPPSIQHKLDTHKKLINQIKKILPITSTIVEVAKFDIQKIKNPEILSYEYQQGEQLGFYNVREYVLHRDGHKCQYPKCNHKDVVLNVHHITSRQVGSNSPDNLITLCSSCHKKLHKSKIKLKVKPSKSFKAETFMTMIRWRLVQELGCDYTFGYVTKSRRIELGLPKSHVNDAFIIAGGSNQIRCNPYIIKQVRKSNRKLHRGSRSHIKNTAPRFVFGFQRYDKVKYKGIICFVFGRRLRGYFQLKKIDGTLVHGDAKVIDIKLLESSKTLLITKEEANSSYRLKSVVPFAS